MRRIASSRETSCSKAVFVCALHRLPKRTQWPSSECSTVFKHHSTSLKARKLVTRVSSPERDVVTEGIGDVHKSNLWNDPRVNGLEDVEEEDFLALTDDEIEDRVDEAAGMICVIDDLRPLEPGAFNPCAEIWKRVARVPPWARHRILQELEPGALRSLWKASMARYVLDDATSLQLIGSYSVWGDFPQQPGQVFTFDARCEMWDLRSKPVRFFVDQKLQDRYPRSKPWLVPSPGAAQFPSDNFKFEFFVHPTSSELYARVVMPWMFGLDAWWVPSYLRLKPELCLTPMREDAGADMTLEFPDPSSPNLNGWLKEVGGEVQGVLTREQLPSSSWPGPRPGGAWSPLSLSARDYVRVAGPGLYVGCAYRAEVAGQYKEEDFVYFAMARRFSKEQYILENYDVE